MQVDRNLIPFTVTGHASPFPNLSTVVNIGGKVFLYFGAVDAAIRSTMRAKWAVRDWPSQKKQRECQYRNDER